MTDRLPAGTAFARQVCPIEQWFLGFPASMSPVTNLCVEGTGRLDVEDLRRAVAVASEACPGARLVRRGRMWVDGGVSPAVRVVPGAADLCDVPELRSPLPTRSGAQCEVLLVDGPEPTVVLRASHVVMDGRGLILWARDVFRALRGEEPAGARSTETVLDLDNAFYRRAGQAEAASGIPSLLGVPPRANIRRQVWRRRVLTGTFPALSAKLAAAVTAFSGRSSAPIRFPLDLRPFHPELRSTGNHSLVLSLDVESGESWEEIYQRLLTTLSDQEGGQIFAPDPSILKAPVPVLRYFIRRGDRAARREDDFNATAIVNNLGRIPAEWFHTATFEAAGTCMLSPMEPATAVSLVATEGDGRTDITVAWWDGPGMSERVDALLDRMEEELAPPAHRERNRLTSAPLPGSVPGVVERFREQVRLRPDAIAVRSPDEECTYAELDRRMRGVAAALRERGIGREDVVGLLADQTVHAIAGAWGVLMSGAAYLPMDPQHPDARIRTLLTDAGASVCLTGRSHAGRDHRPDGCDGLVLEDLPRDADLTPAVPAPGDLAYVVYTSGSTGRPKGVEIEHGSLAAYAHCATREHGIDASTRLPLLCSLSFDLAQLSLNLPLTVGGTLMLMGEEMSHLGLQEVIDAGATALSLTPSHLDLISRLDLRPGAVRSLLVIGEQFTRGGALRAREVFGPDCLISNMYGPAEATVAVGHHHFDAEHDEGASVPIGVPYDGVGYHVLDAGRAYVAPGETGELYLGGRQLARGYRGRPDLTRERFVRLADGTRVYRTGDIVRRLPSGDLEFCGRIDDQLKVLGHRIEPAEIVRTMETHPSVSGAVVVARTRSGARDKTLCGYVTAQDGPVDVEELTAYLAERLPGYMVPAAIVPVGEFPRSINGKIATASLPDPFADGAPVTGGTLEGMQDTVAQIWSRLLGVEVERLSGTSDFHQLGGDSLSLITMVAQVARHAAGPDGERAFVRHMPEIIRRTTVEHVAELATRVGSGADVTAGTAFTRPIDPIEWWFLGFPDTMPAALNLCVEGTGSVDRDALDRAVTVASAACPGARLVRRERTWVDGGVAPAVRVAHGVPADAPELRTPLPGPDGATCEVVLFPGPEPTVVFRAGHAVMDVRGVLWWARDVFRALRGEQPVGAPSTATFDDLDDPLHRRGGGDGPEPEVPALLGVPPGADLGRQLWRRRTVAGNPAAPEARLAAALVRMSGAPGAPVGFVVDVRPAHPEVRSTGNLSLAVSLDLPADASWPEVDRQLSAALADRTCRVDAPDAGILRAPLPVLRDIVERLDRDARRDDRHSLLAEVYHLGPVRPEWFHADGFVAAAGYALCPMEPGAALCVVATEGQDRTDLTLSWWDGPGMSERVDALLDRLDAALAVPED